MDWVKIFLSGFRWSRNSADSRPIYEPADGFERCVYSIIKEHSSMRWRSKPLSPEYTLEESGLDSLAKAETIMDLEDEFDITISDRDIDKLKTLGHVHEYIRTKIDPQLIGNWKNWRN